MLNFSQSSDRKQRYKRLIEEANQLQHLIGNQQPTEICPAVLDFIYRCHLLHKEASNSEAHANPSEAVMDGQLLRRSYELISRLLTHTEFNDVMYQNSINELIYQNDTDNWMVFTKIAVAVARPCLTKSGLLGAIDVEPKEKVCQQRSQRRQTVLAAEKRPEVVKQLKRNDCGAQKVNIIFKLVSDVFRNNDRQPVPYYKLIIDPDNFMNTVENAFQMAFLARDGNIAIERGQDGYPQVRLASKGEIELQQDFSQSICTLNMGICQDMIKFYKIQRPMLNVPDEDQEEGEEGEEDDEEEVEEDDEEEVEEDDEEVEEVLD